MCRRAVIRRRWNPGIQPSRTHVLQITEICQTEVANILVWSPKFRTRGRLWACEFLVRHFALGTDVCSSTYFEHEIQRESKLFGPGFWARSGADGHRDVALGYTLPLTKSFETIVDKTFSDRRNNYATGCEPGLHLPQGRFSMSGLRRLGSIKVRTKHVRILGHCHVRALFGRSAGPFHLHFWPCRVICRPLFCVACSRYGIGNMYTGMCPSITERGSSGRQNGCNYWNCRQSHCRSDYVEQSWIDQYDHCRMVQNLFCHQRNHDHQDVAFFLPQILCVIY